MRGMGYPIPVLLALVIGLLLECIQVDALHAIDLGFGSHVIANTFWHTIKRHCWGEPNQDANAWLHHLPGEMYKKTTRKFFAMVPAKA